MTRALLFCLALSTLAACETAKGAGQDIKKAGDAISQTASNIQKKM